MGGGGVGAGTVGYDRVLLERLLRASLDAAEQVAALGSWDPAAADAITSLRATESFLRDEWLPAIRSILDHDALTRPLSTGVRPQSTVDVCSLGDVGGFSPLPGRPIDLGDMVQRLLTQVLAESAQYDLDHPFWTGTGADRLDDLRRRLLADPGTLDDLLALPAAAPVAALLLDQRRPLPRQIRHRLAIHVLSTPFAGRFAESELAADAVRSANAVLHDDGDAVETLLLDVDATLLVLERGHVSPTRLGGWLQTTADRIVAGEMGDQRSVDLIQALGRLAAHEPFGPSAPTAVAVPIATLTGAMLNRLAAGRTPGGPFLYPTIDGERRDDEWVRRDDLRELIGIALHDQAATAALLTDVRRALRTAVGSESPELDVVRVDELARVIDDAVRHEGAEADALAAAQREWISSMFVGLDKAATTIGSRSGPLAGAAAGAVADAIERFADVVVADERLPFDTMRTYYDMARTFEIRRRAVLDATPPTRNGAELAAARRALHVVDGHLDANLDGAVHAANVAWLDFEDTSEPFVDLSRFPETRW